MSDGVLSQEEIDALLKSSAIEEAGNNMDANIDGDSGSNDLTMAEKDALSEVLNIVMGSSSTALSTLLEKRVEITAPYIESTNSENIRTEHPEKYIAVYVDYTKGLQGTNALLFKNNDAAAMVDLMMGGPGIVAEGELNDMQLGAFSEAMNQMLGSATSSMSTLIKDMVEIAPPSVVGVSFPEGALRDSLGTAGQNLVKISFSLNIEDVFDSEILQIIPLDLARRMAQGMMEDAPVSQSQTHQQPEPQAYQPEPQTITQQQVAATAQAVNPFGVPPQEYAANQQASPVEVRASGAPKREIPVQPVQFAPLQPNYSATEVSNIDLIMDVPLQLTVELGRSKKTIREILALGQGSVIELDKLAGEPVDLLVNGKLLAKGEVVVIDENFGIRVSDIISPLERVTSLQ